MKKLLIILFLIFTFILPIGVYGDCNIKADEFNGDIGGALDTCLSNSALIDGKDVNIGGGFNKLINQWVRNISVVLGILAVGTIVYGSLLMTLSAGEEEKIKKAKDIIKWGLIGFLGLIFASSIILLIVNIMYSIEV